MHSTLELGIMLMLFYLYVKMFNGKVQPWVNGEYYFEMSVDKVSSEESGQFLEALFHLSVHPSYILILCALLMPVEYLMLPGNGLILL